jgi:hypothetical protein
MRLELRRVEPHRLELVLHEELRLIGGLRS